MVVALSVSYGCVQVGWEEVEPEEDEAATKNPSIAQYLMYAAKPTKGKQSRIHPYFKERCLQPLASL